MGEYHVLDEQGINREALVYGSAISVLVGEGEKRLHQTCRKVIAAIGLRITVKADLGYYNVTEYNIPLVQHIRVVVSGLVQLCQGGFIIIW